MNIKNFTRNNFKIDNQSFKNEIIDKTIEFDNQKKIANKKIMYSNNASLNIN